ncbi:MAG: response regulator [Phenylobacterium sp.]
MLEDLDARRSAARVSHFAAELALPVLAAAILAILVLPQTTGLGRIAAAAAAFAVVVHAALGLWKAKRAAERDTASRAAMAGAVEAIEGAGRATAGVLGLLQAAVIPALDKSQSLAGAMMSDHRLSASVRGRVADIRAVAEDALAILHDVAGAPLETAEAVVAPAPAAPSPGSGSAEPQAAALHDLEAVAEPAPPEPQWAAEAASLDGLRVLVAESNGVHQLFLRTHLAQFGVEPRIVADGVEAIEAWRAEGWDLILLDLDMPRMDGLEAARMIRSVETRFSWAVTPIVGLTANGSARQAAACIEAGMSGCVAKPIDGEALFEAMEAALSAPGRPADDLPVRMARAA